ILFYLYHCYITDVIVTKIQLGGKSFLTPESYNQVPIVDQMTGLLYNARIQTNKITYFNEPVLHLFWIGFGDYCSVTDAIVEDVLNTIDNVKPPVPAAIQRMPRDIQRTYYPKFYSGNYSMFDYYMPDVGDCNAECRPMPVFQGYADTENGLRQMRRYYYDENFVVSPVLYLSQAQLTRNFQYWTKRGIKGPKPYPWVGTDLYQFFKPTHILDTQWLKTYGNIYGTFNMDEPVITIAKPELIQQVLVKDFHVFADRKGRSYKHPVLHKNVFYSTGDDWKRLRSIISPTFTSGKMRKMYHLVGECLQEYIEILDEMAVEGR
ncbi:unnamed protein product, partial [Medioppia subpectinata]